MMQTDLSTTRTAGSATVRAKAAHLAARWAGADADGRGLVDVASGSEPGRVYRVAVPVTLDVAASTCGCTWGENGGRGCSHVRAAVGYLEAERARIARRAARTTAGA